ncbi:MAG: RNA polymerase sporulation sigma factor SigG [Clostridia bacterium]|nr:RNA polymerase sporulation sigma factor SigG [Clostridia bacterium]
MSGKVLICGINTSELPVYSAEEMAEMMISIKQGDEDAKQKFIYGNMRLVLSVIQRFMARKSYCQDDLFQVGCVGLIKAIDNFNISLNVKFSTYAVPMIIGEIRRFLRDNNPIRVSRSLRDIAYKALQSREKLEKNLQREATLEEIAADMEIPYYQVVHALDAISEPMSLDEPLYTDDLESTSLSEHITDEQNTDEKWIDNVSIKDAICTLNSREKKILMLRYYLGKTQIEVSEEIGISQAQVSRLEKNALNVVKKFLI